MHLEDELLTYADAGDGAFHMPGHKRQTDVNSFLGGHYPLASIDITEIPGFDDLHNPRGILKEEMERAAAFYGTRATLFSVNGSTASNLTAISAAVPFGGRLLMAANCHRSVAHAAGLRQNRADVIELDEIAPDVPGPVRPEQVEEAFRAAEMISTDCRPVYDAVVITSPTYEGVVSDVAAIAGIVHAHGSVLIVDEAHGAHLSLHPAFPRSAVRAGERADLVTQSLHKTLPSLTQTSVLHNVTGRVATDELMRWMDIYETSSPSYILMASITSCLHLLMERGPALFEPYTVALAACRERLKGMRRLKLLDPETSLTAGETAFLYDPSKIVIMTDHHPDGSGGSLEPESGPALTGFDLVEQLRRDHHLIFEKAEPHYALAMTSAADSAETLGRLADALLEIDARLASR